MRAGTAWTDIAELWLRKKKNRGKDAGEYELIIIPEGAQQQLQGTAELQVHRQRLMRGLQSTCCTVSESGIQNESVHFHTVVPLVKEQRDSETSVTTCSTHF